MTRIAVVALASLFAIASAAQAQWTSSRPDGHAPIGVMGDHRHHAGEVMLSFRFMYMFMEGSQVGTDPVTDQVVITPAPDGYDFLVTPTKMTMQMYMFGAMWAPTDRITLMAMLPLVYNEMDHIPRMWATAEDPAFTTTSGGVADLTVSALVGVAGWDRQAVHLNLGLGIPTGSITQQDVLPTSDGQPVQLPYPMQLGTGSWDLLLGGTYLGQVDHFSWGSQFKAAIRLGENDRGWKVGNAYMGTAWGAWRISSHVSASGRAKLLTWGNYEGADPAPSVDPAVVYTARTDLRGGTRLDLSPGLNISIPKAKGLRFAGEFLVPVYQDLDGPQLQTDWTLILGIQAVPVH